MNLPKVPDSEIRKILASIAKENKEDEKDCGGCGYSSCREKAAAVYYGFAEKKMCISYMKARAESLSQIIVESSHNAIIVVNDQMDIQKFNPVAKELFTQKSRKIEGMKLDKFIDSSNFKKAWNLNQRFIHQKCSYKNKSIIVDQTIFALKEHRVIVVILTDISEQEKQREKMQKMKEVAVEKTNAVVNKQMQNAEIIKKENKTIVVLSDGLGSSIKANILSTLTSKIASGLLEKELPLKKILSTILGTLPVCELRGIAYSTLAFLNIDQNQQLRLIEIDSPVAFLFRNDKVEKSDYQEFELEGKKIRESNFK